MSPLDESKLWLLRREDIVGKEEGPWEDWLIGETRHGILGTLDMLGVRIRFGMLLRSVSMHQISTNHTLVSSVTFFSNRQIFTFLEQIRTKTSR